MPWCSSYHYCTTFVKKPWTQVRRRFISCYRLVRDFWWWEYMTMIPIGNKAKCLSSVNHTTKTIHHHHRHHHCHTHLREPLTMELSFPIQLYLSENWILISYYTSMRSFIKMCRSSLGNALFIPERTTGNSAHSLSQNLFQYYGLKF